MIFGTHTLHLHIILREWTHKNKCEQPILRNKNYFLDNIFLHFFALSFYMLRKKLEPAPCNPVFYAYLRKMFAAIKVGGGNRNQLPASPAATCLR